MLFALFALALPYTLLTDVLITCRLPSYPMGVLDICESCKKFFVARGIKLPHRPVIKISPASPKEFSHSNLSCDTLPEEQPSTESVSGTDEIHAQNLHNLHMQMCCMCRSFPGVKPRQSSGLAL